MTRDQIGNLFARIPAAEHSSVVLVLRMGLSITVDTVARVDDDMLVLRGREAGTNDEGRGFFVPFDEIAYFKIERTVKTADLQALFDGPAPALPAAATSSATPGPAAVTPTPAPQPQLDPAAIAKANLLERIRAARTSASAAILPRPGGK